VCGLGGCRRRGCARAEETVCRYASRRAGRLNPRGSFVTRAPHHLHAIAPTSPLAADAGDASSADPRAARRAALAAAVAASVREGGIKMSGRVLFALRAVDKEEAGRLRGVFEATGRSGGAVKFDRRHTYLAYEGARRVVVGIPRGREKGAVG
jgi:hypothetical protein